MGIVAYCGADGKDSLESVSYASSEQQLETGTTRDSFIRMIQETRI